MKTRLHIVANCADRKRLPVPAERRLGTHRASGSRSRMSSFIAALSASRGESVEAKDLYVGPYWAVVRELPVVADASRIDAELWIASAGYGLVPSNAKLHGYSATFRVGEPDSVASTTEPHSVAEQVSAWWAGLASWRGPSRAPRRVTELAAVDPRAIVMVLGSPRYVQAMSDDLRGAARLLGDRLIIVTSHEFELGHPLRDNVVVAEERLLAEVQGARPALQARVARHILANARRHGLGAAELRRKYDKLAEGSGFRRTPERSPMTDRAVRLFITRQLHATPNLSCTRALRVLRDGGRACEQKRFKNLFREVSDRAH